MIFAQAAASDHTGIVTLYVVAIVVPILMLVCTVIGLVVMARRQPPMGEEMYRTFVTKTEQREVADRIDHSVEAAFIEINAMRNQLSKAYGDFERALGRLEGSIEGMPCHQGKNCPPTKT